MGTKEASNLSSAELDQVTGGEGVRMGNFEIQTMMSTYNQAASSAGSVKRARDDANAAAIAKV